jgi:hypothetical protein
MHKSWYTIGLAIAAIATLSVAPAFAAGPEKTGDTKASGAPSVSGGTGASDFTGRHTMTGEVTRVDQKKGELKLKTAEGMLDLHFPPSALSNVKKGDRVSVELALKPEGASPSASPVGRSSTSDSAGKKY